MEVLGAVTGILLENFTIFRAGWGRGEAVLGGVGRGEALQMPRPLEGEALLPRQIEQFRTDAVQHGDVGPEGVQRQVQPALGVGAHVQDVGGARVLPAAPHRGDAEADAPEVQLGFLRAFIQPREVRVGDERRLGHEFSPPVETAKPPFWPGLSAARPT